MLLEEKMLLEKGGAEVEVEVWNSSISDHRCPNTGICVVFSRSANISAAFSLWGSWQETGSLRGGQALTHWSEVGPADRKQIITFVEKLRDFLKVFYVYILQDDLGVGMYTNQAHELDFIDLLPYIRHKPNP